MTNRDTQEMIDTCIREITQLRARVNQLEPKAHAYDTVTQILGLLPRPNEGAGIDVLWQLKRQLSDLQAEDAFEAASAKIPGLEA